MSAASSRGKVSSAAGRGMAVELFSSPSGASSSSSSFAAFSSFSATSRWIARKGSRPFAEDILTRATRPFWFIGQPLRWLSMATSTSTSGGIACLLPGVPAGQRKAIAWWLGGCSAWVASMVVLGGVTRLTRSGLSMTDWKFTGEMPPRTEEEWTAEFSRYQKSPEFRRVNSSMTLDEFKFIYWMEWAHRMWGRGLGIAFALPALFFYVRGAIPSPLLRRLGLLLAMGGTQGLIGWWMVRSGLHEPSSPYEVPRVSPYRLATHLASAFVIYGTLLWTTFQVALPRNPKDFSSLSMKILKKRSAPVTALLAMTAASGAFVAGLDAGHAYNTFPTMNGEWIPAEYWAIDGWRNAFENTAAVQFHHRMLALSSVAAVTALWATSVRLPGLPRSTKTLLYSLLGAVGAQASLGVATLLTHVPVSLGSLHQAGALGLLTIASGLLYNTGAFSQRIAPLGILGIVMLLGASLATTFDEQKFEHMVK